MKLIYESFLQFKIFVPLPIIKRICICRMDKTYFESNGWSWCSDEEIVKPVWFVNSQLPPSCDKKRKRGNINASTLKKSKRQRFEPNL